MFRLRPLLLLALAGCDASGAKPSAPPQEPPCEIRWEPGATTRVLVFPERATVDTWSQFTSGKPSSDDSRAFVAVHGGFMVEAGTKCQRLSGSSVREVKITSGEHSGKTVWMPAERTGMP